MANNADASQKKDLVRFQKGAEGINRVALLKCSIAVVVSMAFPWSLWLTYLGEQVVATIVLSAVPLAITCFFLVHLSKVAISKFIWVMGTTAILVILSLHSSTQIGQEVMYFVLFGFPFLFYSPRKESLIFCIILGIISMAALYAYLDMSFGVSHIFGIPPRGNTVPSAYVKVGIYITVTAAIVAQLWFFSSKIENASTRLIASMKTAQKSEEARGKFIADMSHEIRTPMISILGALELIEDSQVDKEALEKLRTIETSAKCLMEVVDDILDSSKIDANMVSISPRVTNLGEVSRAAAKTLSPLAEKLGVTLKLFMDPKLPTEVMIDALRTRQILLNLISNSVKYSDKSLTNRLGEVSIYVRAGARNSVKFEVRDNGVGMCSQLVESFLNPYVQAPKAQDAQIRGTGLGMSITSRLIQLMEGQISVASVEGQGTNICVELPIGAQSCGTMQTTLPRSVYVGTPSEDMREGLSLMFGDRKSEIEIVGHIDFVTTELLLKTDPEFLIISAEILEADDRVLDIAFDRHPGLSILCLRSSQIAGRIDRAFADNVTFTDQIDFQSHLATNRSIKKTQHSQLVKEAPSLDEISLIKKSESTVLIVDDNQLNCEVLSTQLTRLGYSVVSAQSGERALSLWKEQEFAAVVTDLNMPMMSGLELIQEIRRFEARSLGCKTTTVILSAGFSQQDTIDFERLGVDEWMIKPCKIATLEKVLQNQMRH
jgi:two-component system capsular synthesis sensor histidine kinase RcsC